MATASAREQSTSFMLSLQHMRVNEKLQRVRRA
jgi:hypothetical protein